MVRSRQLGSASARSGVIRLIVTAVERSADEDGAQNLAALHGVNAGRAWRLTMRDVLAALGTGRYVFEVEYRGDRRRAEVLGSDGSQRLFAPSPVHGELLDLLPEVSEEGEPIEAASQVASAAAGTSQPSMS